MLFWKQSKKSKSKKGRQNNYRRTIDQRKQEKCFKMKINYTNRMVCERGKTKSKSKAIELTTEAHFNLPLFIYRTQSHEWNVVFSHPKKEKAEAEAEDGKYLLRQTKRISFSFLQKWSCITCVALPLSLAHCTFIGMHRQFNLKLFDFVVIVIVLFLDSLILLLLVFLRLLCNPPKILSFSTTIMLVHVCIPIKWYWTLYWSAHCSIFSKLFRSIWEESNVHSLCLVFSHLI